MGKEIWTCFFIIIHFKGVDGLRRTKTTNLILLHHSPTVARVQLHIATPPSKHYTPPPPPVSISYYYYTHKYFYVIILCMFFNTASSASPQIPLLYIGGLLRLWHPHSARSNPHLAISHPHSARFHPHLAISHPHSARSHPPLG
jgi:hypothetical protein